jgi:hypothetical protein
VSVLDDLKRRRDARRWQRWSENDPLDEFGRGAALVTKIAVGLFLAVIVLVVVGLVVAR